MGSENVQRASEAGKSKTAGVIIIGDEVLKGQVADVNSYYLAKELYSLGIKLCRIATIADDLVTIAAEVSHFSGSYDYVFTTGGIGPTHDDMTYLGVSQAFGEEAKVNEEMARMLQVWLAGKGYEPELITKMSLMPPDAELLFDPEKPNSFPIVIVRNVYVFPGIPQYVQRMFPRLRPLLGKSTFYAKTLYVDAAEMRITPQLNRVVDAFKGQVTFGSYPVLDNLYYSTRISMDSALEGRLEAADELFRKSLPAGSLVNYDDDPVTSASSRIYDMVQNESDQLHRSVAIAVQKIEEALERFGVEGICICFNGGKDCTALLHLFHAVLQQRAAPDSPAPKLQCLSIKYSNPFPEMEDFMHQTTDRYNLNLWSYEGPIQSGLSACIREHPEVKAVLMGTRRSDPSGQNLDYFQMTDSGWPEVMRVSPMLDWTYSDVWHFLRTLTLPYCALYNRGYTSIGSQSNTMPNESLRSVDPSGEVSYRPAYALHDSASERNGRQ